PLNPEPPTDYWLLTTDYWSPHGTRPGRLNHDRRGRLRRHPPRPDRHLQHRADLRLQQRAPRGLRPPPRRRLQAHLHPLCSPQPLPVPPRPPTSALRPGGTHVESRGGWYYKPASQRRPHRPPVHPLTKAELEAGANRLLDLALKPKTLKPPPA